MECCSKFRDINSYENMIENVVSTLPPVSSIQYDGFFNSHFFPLEKSNKENKIIKEIPKIKADISYCFQKNPINLKDESFISILLNSSKDGIKEIKKNLDIVIVLDVSGSMSSYLQSDKSSSEQGSCLTLAKNAIKKLFNKLDSLAKTNKNKNLIHRLALSTFSQTAKEIFGFKSAEEIKNLDELLSKIKASGGTSLFHGIYSGYKMMSDGSRDFAEKKIIFITDMNDNEDPRFFECLKKITSNKISVDIIGIGHDLNLIYAEKTADIKNITINTVFKQEEVEKILVDDFEFNFFPIAKDLKIEFLSNNLKILKSYGTGYENTIDKNDEICSEESLLLKNQIKDSNSLLIYFKILRNYYKNKYNRVPLYIFETIGSFLKFNKKEVAEVDKLTPCELKYVNDFKMIKGNMILLKVKVEDLELHKTLGRHENAEIILNYFDCSDENQKKIKFPILLNFNTENREIKISHKISKESFLIPEYNSESINLALSLYLTAKLLRKYLKKGNKFIFSFNQNRNQQNLEEFDFEKLEKFKYDLEKIYETKVSENGLNDFIVKNLKEKIDNLLKKMKIKINELKEKGEKNNGINYNHQW